MKQVNQVQVGRVTKTRRVLFIIMLGQKTKTGTVPSNPGHVSSDYKASPRRRWETRTVPWVRLPWEPRYFTAQD